jgi:hypothetical protein
VKIARYSTWAIDEGEHALGGCALVNWKAVCRLKDHVGLGMLDFQRSGLAIKLHWSSMQSMDSERNWAESKLPSDNLDMAIFHAYMKTNLGNGETASVCRNNWRE